MAYRIANSIRPDPTPKRKPAKSKDYLAFIHDLPCCVSGRYGVEAAHLSCAAARYGHYGRGKGSKVSDRWVLPLHPDEHRRQHGMNEERYWRAARINPHVLALTIHGLWTDMGEDAAPFATAIINQTLADAGAFRSRDEV
ncbi:DUF968 domain-containing protein [Sinorhizobium meliloti]|uniref:DUF968 domain-containing protein n=1 Tax=Rhizobium meliloti TaxID=382 RepID=UPI000FD6F513|nr:DUF968 domain-containing protein [Sinorhizobium meliloti]RVP65557.1 DUF968 domain-containing protein [Sinorhizobium meliloti]